MKSLSKQINSSKIFNLIFKTFQKISYPITKTWLLCLYLFLLYYWSYIGDHPDMYDWFKIKEGIFDSFIISYFVGLFPRKISFYISCIVVFIDSLLVVTDIYLKYKFGINISPIALQLIFETNTEEALEFANLYLKNSFVIGLIIKLIILNLSFVIINKYTKIYLNIFQRTNVYKIINNCIIYLFLIFFFMSIMAYNGISTIDNKKKIIYLCFTSTSSEASLSLMKMNSNNIILYKPIYRFAFSLHSHSLTSKETENVYNKIKQINLPNSNDIIFCNNSSPIIVLIIGESYTYLHSELYGYNYNTTPFQKKRLSEGSLIAFNDVITPWNLTGNAFKYFLSVYSYGTKGNWSTSYLFPSIFKKAGYNISFLSNVFIEDSEEKEQFDDGYFINNKNISPLLFDCRNKSRFQYDEDLLVFYEENRERILKEKSLIIFHLIGQHVDFNLRFKKKFAKFQSKDYSDRKDLSINQKQILADYDNATLYNDFIVESIIKRFESENAIIIYMPDHGEEVFDGNNELGRKISDEITPIIARNEFHIPFWIWVSDSYNKTHPELIKNLKNSIDNPYMTDDLPHTLFDIAGIRYKDYDEERSIINPKFNKNRKRLMKGYIDYDELMKGHEELKN